MVCNKAKLVTVLEELNVLAMKGHLAHEVMGKECLLETSGIVQSMGADQCCFVVTSLYCFLQEQYNDALQQLEQLLQQQPGNYAALAQLLTLLRRVGRAQEGQAYLHTAQEHVSRTAGSAGATCSCMDSLSALKRTR